MKEWYTYLTAMRQHSPHTPSDQLWANKRDFGYLFHIWTFFLLTPFAIAQYLEGKALLGALIGTVAVYNIMVVYFLARKDHYLLNGWGLLISASGAVLYSSHLNGMIGILWAFPLAAAFFFLLKWRHAVIGVLIFIIAEAEIALSTVEGALTIRVLATLFLTAFVMAAFAWLLEQQQADLYRLATTDALTGCGNRMKLNDALAEAAYAKHRYESTYSLIVLDVDHFKRINDSIGHSGGDEVLTRFAECLRSRLRLSDHVYRYGGEEFMVLLPNTRLKDAVHVAEDLRLAVASTHFGAYASVTISAGVAQLKEGESWDNWMTRADQALYQAKSDGRNRVVSHTESG